MINRTAGGTSGWGRNIPSWLSPRTPLATQVEIRFEELITNPADSVHRAVAETAPDLQSIHDAQIPTSTTYSESTAASSAAAAPAPT